MENTNLTTKQLLERWKLLVEHKNDGLPVVLLKDVTITYFDNNMAEIKKMELSMLVWFLKIYQKKVKL